MTNGAAIFDPYSSASMLLDDLAARRISATALLEAHVTRFQKLNPQLNAVIKTDLPRARETAARLDRDASNGKIVGPLHGLPMTVKDTFDVNGLPAVAGAPEYADRSTRVEDAAIVKRLKDAGAVIWGKTNTPYLAGDCQTYNSVYGVTNNPYDPKLTPGGSSGGAAAALASGVTPLEVGSDIGGSLRTPAHFCGVCSLKPSYGRISVAGHIPPAPGALSARDLNVAGPMARNVADLKRLFSVIADTSTGDNASPAPLNMRRLAIWSEDDAFPLSQACKEAVKRASDAARDAGAQTAKAKPDIDGAELLDIYMQLLIATLAGDLPPAMLGAMEAARPLAKLFVG
ncbi:MAG: amidase family protein, partial [Pseudomonadota bacterium]